MLSDRQLTHLFGNPVFVGTILQYTSMLEYDIDCLLALYISRPDRVDFVLDVVLPELTFNRKLEVFKQLPLKHTKAHGDTIVVTLVPFGYSSKREKLGFSSPLSLTLADEFARGSVPERAVWLHLIVITLP